MISSKDRSGYFGASDTDKLLSSYASKTFTKWWLQKLGISRDNFKNKYTDAGTYYEHRILESLEIPIELDKQIIIEDLKLRVNLDGNDDSTIYECKTYLLDNGYNVPKKHVNQVQVQMFATGYRNAEIVAYGLMPDEYDNYFREIDKSRLQRIKIPYDENWINTVYLPKLIYLADCLKQGRFPKEKEVKNEQSV